MRSFRPQNSSNYRAGVSYLLGKANNASIYFNSATNFAPLTSIPTNLDPSINPVDLKSPLNRSYVFGGKWQTRGGRLKMDLEVGKKIGAEPVCSCHLRRDRSKCGGSGRTTDFEDRGIRS